MKKLAVMVLTVLLVFGVAGAGMAVPIFSDNFDSERGGVGVTNFNGFTQWSVSDGTVDLIGNGYFDFLPGNGLYVDMDGSTGNAGKMTSINIPLNPGSYVLSFDLAGNHRNGAAEQVNVQVIVGPLFSNSYSLAQNDPFTRYEETFVVLSAMSVNLVFEGVGKDNIGMLLDNVELNAVPEPGTMLLLGFGLVGLAGFGRKLKK
jgi:hypothetical protein